MQKIMFSDRFGLTGAVREGWKRQTRREEDPAAAPKYAVGEFVAIARCYRDLGWPEGFGGAGYKNKMFVRAEDMPESIRITAVRGEMADAISEKDALLEGIRPEGRYFTFTDSLAKTPVPLYDNPRSAFFELFRRLTGKDPRRTRIFVRVYDFELCVNAGGGNNDHA